MEDLAELAEEVEALEKLFIDLLASTSSMEVQFPYRSIMAHKGCLVSTPEKNTPKSPPLMPK